jgi:PAS domain S-box-containing protein
VRIDTGRIINTSILSAMIVALLMTLATELVLGQVRRQAIVEAGEVQQGALRVFWELTRLQGEYWEIRDNKLWLGDRPMNGNNALPDKVRDITGSSATIFQGDTRIATNVLGRDGQRALGTRLTGPAREALFSKGLAFHGETQILGETYFTAYGPIRDRSGRVIGALFAGTQQSDYLEPYNRTALRIRIINGTLTCIFILCGLLLRAERRRSQDAIRKQLDFLQGIIDTIPSPVFYKDREGRYLGFNKRYESYVGMSRACMLGKTVHDLWPPDLAQVFHRMDQELFDGPGTQVYETTVGHADGTRHVVIMNKATFTDHRGDLGGLVGVMQDITDLKEAEKASRNAYRRIADILEFLPDATFVVDQDNRVIAWNRAIEQLTGVAKEEVLGQGDFVYALPFYGERRGLLINMLDEDLELLQHRYPGVTRNGRTLTAEARIMLRGSECYIWSAASPLFDMQGNQMGGIQTLRDVTQSRLAEQEKVRLELHLQHSTLVASLLAQLSHDLRTPLTPLFALLPLLRRKLCDPKQQRMLDICLNSTEQIQGLTAKALDLVRLSGQAASLELTGLDLAATAQLSLAGCSELFRQRGIRCHNGIDPGLQVLGSAEQLTLLFDNLLSNAARFSRENGEIRLNARCEGATVRVSVEDDGIGLEPAHRELIFQEFFKVDKARQDTGTQGLGLAICKSIVINHRGSIWAESPGPDRGTTINFTLQAMTHTQHTSQGAGI